MATKNTVKNYTKFADTYDQHTVTSFYHQYIEKPAMYSLLPDLKNKKVLCIGVGTGEEALFLAYKGAKVIGTDISEGMISLAKQKYPLLDFHVTDMDKLSFPSESFDFIYSSLAFHYSENINTLFKNFYRMLKKGGSFLFSTTHPVLDVKEDLLDGDIKYKILGLKKDKKLRKTIAIGNYFGERKRKLTYSEEFFIDFNHYTITEWLHAIIAAGFKITNFLEPQPIPAGKKINPQKYDLYRKIPLYMIISGEKTYNESLYN